MEHMESLGYTRLIERLNLNVRPPDKTACLSGAVNRRVDSADRILFPKGVAIEDNLLGHLEFALRHEEIRLDIVAETFKALDPGLLIARLRDNPNGEYIRKLCFLWEWMTDSSLGSEIIVRSGYIDLLPSEKYAVASRPQRNPKYRINNNALGNRAFCPVVRLDALSGTPSLAELLEQARTLLDSCMDGDELHARAVRYLYLSETRSSFAIEKEWPDASKEERFVQLLRRAGEKDSISEDWLVELQNATVRYPYAMEASYRLKQNWLEDYSGRITFFPPPVEDIRDLMAGWEVFANDTEKGIDPLVKIACASFGFVYMHPFLDGNGRLHRFLVHQLLAGSGLLEKEVPIPVSAIFMRKLPEYLNVLTEFSKPVTALWEYARTESDPHILAHPGAAPYRYWDASREVAFLHEAIKCAVLEQIPREIGFLRGYDRAFERINSLFDLPQKDISSLIRMIYSNDFQLSKHRRKQYSHLPEEVLDGLEAMVRESFIEVSG